MSGLRNSALACLALGLLAGCGGGISPENEPIELGVAGPLNQSAGESMKLAAEMAVEEINEAGGIDGREVALVMKDDRADPERAIQVAEELRSDPGVVAVIGHVNSSATLASSDIYNDEGHDHDEHGVAQISPASSSPQITDAGPWTFRVCPSDLQHGPALASWAHSELNGHRIAVLYANDAYGRGVLQSFTRAVRETQDETDAEVIARDPYQPSMIESPTALDPYLIRALRSDMDVLMIAGQAEEAEVIVRAARRLGYTGPVMGADGITGLAEAGGIAEGVYISSAFLPDRPTEEAQAFVSDYRERYDALPDHRGAMTYDAIRLVARAIDEVGADRAAIRDYLSEVGTDRPDFQGVSGTVAFDENGDVAGKDITIGVVQGDELVTAGS